MSRHFLYLTNTRLVSITTRGKRIVMRREFAVSGAGAAEFERYLAALATVAASVSRPGMISISFMTGTGEKK